MLKTHESDKLSHTVCKLNTSSRMLAHVTLSGMTDFDASGKSVPLMKSKGKCSHYSELCFVLSLFLQTYFILKYFFKKEFKLITNVEVRTGG